MPVAFSQLVECTDSPAQALTPELPATGDKYEPPAALNAPSHTELPSVGSVGHEDGTCKRCAFFLKGRCKNGKDCSHCHFTHEQRKRRRNRAKSPHQTSQLGQVEVVLAPMRDDATIASDEEESLPEIEQEETNLREAVSPSSPVAELGLKVRSTSVPESTASVSNSELETTATSISTTPPASTSASDCEEERLAISEEDAVLDVSNKARAILNKLAASRFEALCAQLLALPLSTPARLETLVAEVFLAATTQRCFLPLYAELCLRLDQHLSIHEGASGGKAFRKALVCECQASFEHHLRSATLSPSDAVDAEAMRKSRRLGNVRFIGELLVRRLIHGKVIAPIVKELLGDGTEASLESLVALLEVLGPHYEQRVASQSQAPSKDTACSSVTPLHGAFAEVKRRSLAASRGATGAPVLSMRVRCKIRDLLEARERGWTPRDSVCA